MKYRGKSPEGTMEEGYGLIRGGTFLCEPTTIHTTKRMTDGGDSTFDGSSYLSNKNECQNRDMDRGPSVGYY